MKKAYPKGNENKDAIRCSWAEQMLINKVAQYHYRCDPEQAFEIIKETEKALQIAVPVYTNGGKEDVWNVWMPKSAMVVVDY